MGLITRTWKRCKSISQLGGGGKGRFTARNRRRVGPEGCFSVYVGPERQKFVVKTEHANHPLFRVLLDEAEAEYGYGSNGPIELPCNVQVFWRVLMEMDSDDGVTGKRHGCGFGKGHGGGYRLLSPSQMVAINQF